MGEPFLSEIRIFSFGYAPRGWALCNGQLLPINQNQALFSLLGTTYGGNGQTNFALPDLRGDVPIHVGNGHSLGEKAGTQNVTLTLAQMPQHLPFLNASQTNGNAPVPFGPTGNVLARSLNQIYTPPHNLVPVNPASVSNVGGSQPHLNLQPFLTLSFCIALQGIFPSQN